MILGKNQVGSYDLVHSRGHHGTLQLATPFAYCGDREFFTRGHEPRARLWGE